MRLIPLILVLLGALGCTTARDRDQETNLWQSYEFKSGQIEEAFNQRFRTASLYLDNQMVLEVDALYRDRAYRSFFQGDLARLYFYSAKQKAQIWAKEQEEYENSYAFIAVIYSGGYKAPDFGHPSSHWQAFLKDDEGDLLRPSSVKRLSKKSKEAIFLEKYFRPLDRWGEVYLLQFPKLHRSIPQGSGAMELIFSGLKGQARLQWKDLSLFTQERNRFFID